MKAERITDKTPRDLVSSVFGALGNMDVARAPRATAMTTEIDGYTVDTVMGYDTGVWETGIQPPNEEWIIVAQYPNQAAAEAGHAKWVESVKGGQKEFKDIDIFNLGL